MLGQNVSVPTGRSGSLMISTDGCTSSTRSGAQTGRPNDDSFAVADLGQDRVKEAGEEAV
jgi:hypothetical protein